MLRTRLAASCTMSMDGLAHWTMIRGLAESEGPEGGVETPDTPPSYQESTSGPNFWCMDFFPVSSSRFGVVVSPECTNFGSLVTRANNWLRLNPQWEVRSCSTVDIPMEKDLAGGKMIFKMPWFRTHKYYSGLRLWLALKRNGNREPVQIGYQNLTPRKLPGSESPVKYESLQELLERVNRNMRQNPIPGRILTIETKAFGHCPQNEFDPTVTSWEDRLQYLYIIRIFYQIGIHETQTVQIGLRDFVPNLVPEEAQPDQHSWFDRLQYESFSDILRRAAEWCSARHSHRICNLQTVSFPLLENATVNTEQMFHRDNSEKHLLLRIIRVAFATGTVLSPTEVQPSSGITCKMFLPAPTTNSLLFPKWENLSDVRFRMAQWIKFTGAEVLSAETIILNLKAPDEQQMWNTSVFRRWPKVDFEDAHLVGHHFLIGLRLYLNGRYMDPPPALISDETDSQDSIEYACCIL